MKVWRSVAFAMLNALAGHNAVFPWLMAGTGMRMAML